MVNMWSDKIEETAAKLFKMTFAFCSTCFFLFYSGGSLYLTKNLISLGSTTRVCTRSCLPCMTKLMTDGWVHLLYNTTGNSISSQLLSGQPVCDGQEVRPVYHLQNHTCRFTLPQPDRRAAVLGQPSSLRPHLTWDLLLFTFSEPTIPLPTWSMPCAQIQFRDVLHPYIRHKNQIRISYFNTNFPLRRD